MSVFGPFKGAIVSPAAKFVRYRPDGSIDGNGFMAENFVLDEIAAGNLTLVAEGEIGSHYVDVATKSVHPRLPGPAVLTGTTLTNLPDPCRLLIDAASYEVTGGVAELSFPQPGTYRITVASVPYLDQIFTVTIP